MKRGYARGVYLKYPDRHCPHCGDVIPRLDRNGKRLNPSKYARRKTCGKTDCWGESMIKNAGKATRVSSLIMPPPRNEPIDRFIYGL